MKTSATLRLAPLLGSFALLACTHGHTQPAPATPVAVQAAPTAFDLQRPEIQAFLDSVTKKHQFERDWVEGLLRQARSQPRILDLISRPAERTLAWWEYRDKFLTERRIREGAQFWLEHQDALAKLEETTGVAPEYIVAIIGVETFYGRITGTWRVLDALATLGFDYPPRANFFRSELEQFLLLMHDEKIDPLTALGSYAGAMGAPQFIPSSYRRLAVDGNADGVRNLFSDWDDVLASVANYFKNNGWRRGGPVLAEATANDALFAGLDPRNLKLEETVASLRGKGVRFDTDLTGAAPAILLPAELADGPQVRVGFGNFQVITRYNRSIRYAMAVHDLATAIAATRAATLAAPGAAPGATPGATGTVAR